LTAVAQVSVSDGHRSEPRRLHQKRTQLRGSSRGFGHPNQQKLSNYNVGKRSEAPQRHLAGRVEAKRRGPLAEPLEVLERKRKERVDAVAPLRAEIAELRALNAATAALIA